MTSAGGSPNGPHAGWAGFETVAHALMIIARQHTNPGKMRGIGHRCRSERSWIIEGLFWIGEIDA